MYNGFLLKESTVPQLTRTVTVPYSREQMFSLVADINRYAEFLPYCVGAEIIRETQGRVEGRLRVGYHNIAYTLTTLNHNEPPTRIRMALTSGPFKRLEGEWRFTTVSTGTRLDIQLNVEFQFALMALALNHRLNTVADKVVQAFLERARVLYG